MKQSDIEVLLKMLESTLSTMTAKDADVVVQASIIYIRNKSHNHETS